MRTSLDCRARANGGPSRQRTRPRATIAVMSAAAAVLLPGPNTVVADRQIADTSPTAVVLRDDVTPVVPHQPSRTPRTLPSPVVDEPAAPRVDSESEPIADAVGSGVPDASAVAVDPVDNDEPAEPTRLLYVGDSMAWATAGDLQARLPGWQVDALVFGGTAPCDWSAGVAAHPQPVDVVVFSFIGNNLTECTGHATGDVLLEQYHEDLSAICRQAAPARCVAVGQPALGPDVVPTFGTGDQPTTMYRDEATNGGWEFVDAGAAVETSDGGFDPALRDPDGVHFNPAGTAMYATAIAAYLQSSLVP